MNVRKHFDYILLAILFLFSEGMAFLLMWIKGII